jgi:hypothetical protein
MSFPKDIVLVSNFQIKIMVSLLKVASANSLGLIELKPTPLGLIKGGGVKKELFIGCNMESMFSKLSMCAIMQ